MCAFHFETSACTGMESGASVRHFANAEKIASASFSAAACSLSERESSFCFDCAYSAVWPQRFRTSSAYCLFKSGGGADDILDRDQTLFPDTVDQTVYPMEFEHATPTSGTLTSSFGSRLSPITGQPGFHYGLDLAADEGTPITAFADGTVRETGESGYGLYVIVDHADGFATLYAHCSSISAKVGDTVTCGEQIAKVGQTGNATGPHLHLELWHNGAALDPADYLAL